MSLQLYTAVAGGLQITSAIASWPFPAGKTAPLESTWPSTVALLAAGQIVAAGPDAVDNVTPANVERGVPGLKVGVSN